MRIHRVFIKNFRLLADVELVLEDQTTVVVGRNNSGKTSLSEVMRRFLIETPAFLEQSLASADQRTAERARLLVEGDLYQLG